VTEARNRKARNQKPEIRSHKRSGFLTSGLLASDKRCVFIEGDPTVEVRAGRDPFCNARAVEARPYCAKHCAIAYIQPEE
jgi:hypothetical protein